MRGVDPDPPAAEPALSLFTRLGLLPRTAPARGARPGIEIRHPGVLPVLDRRGALSQTRIGAEPGAYEPAMGRTVDDPESLGAAVRRTDPAGRRVFRTLGPADRRVFRTPERERPGAEVIGAEGVCPAIGPAGQRVPPHQLHRAGRG